MSDYPYRNEARKALDRAREALASQDDTRLRHVALELRMAMEALIYARAQAYRAEIPTEELETWQPRKILDLLLSIDPTADKQVTIAVGLEGPGGERPKVMQTLGTDKPLSMTVLKKHYDALGSYLHIPTIRQFESDKLPDLGKLRARCEGIADEIQSILTSAVSDSNIGTFSTNKCGRCEAPIRKRIPHGVEFIETACLECRAPYRLEPQETGAVLWRSGVVDPNCPTEGCSATATIWNDELRPGTWWTCHKCGVAYRLELGIVKVQNPGCS